MAPKRVNAVVEGKSKKTKRVEGEIIEAAKNEVTLFY
jgi:hypothetical protein